MKYAYSIILAAFLLTSCSDFFSPDSDDQLLGDEYISSNTEMYSGFLGLMTKMQAVGDKEILLTETRGEFLQPTSNSTPELISLYNYDTDLQSNSYANPAGYYEVIIACNDYIEKMKEYRRLPGVDDDICQDLISSAVRVKVWAYKTLGEIYGEAVWFDDPITSVSELTAANGYQLLSITELIDKLISVMQTGVDGVATNRDINWIEWLDPSNVTSIASSSYRKWNSMCPPYAGLMAELDLWKGAALDAQGTDARAYYQEAADLMLSALGTYINDESYSGANPYWVPNAGTSGRYQNLWLAQDPYPCENVCAIIYDYKNNQTNTLVKHFSAEYPAEYLLCPTDSGIDRFTNSAKNPGGSSSETRYKYLVGNNSKGKYMSKFRQEGGRSGIRTNAYEDDVHIYIYRATQYHMMLCEALNHLHRYVALSCVLNGGINSYSTEIVDGTNPTEWEGFTRNWTADAEWGNRKYYCEGIRGAFTLSARTIADTSTGTHAEAVRLNDMAILEETMLEFSCEGKVYPWMNRNVLRYGDPSIVADRVCPKYSDASLKSTVRQRIMDGGYFVKYDLNLK